MVEGTEAIIFFVGGIMLDDVKEEQDEYVSKHSGGSSGSGSKDEGLSSKIDTILREAKLDVSSESTQKYSKILKIQQVLYHLLQMLQHLLKIMLKN